MYVALPALQRIFMNYFGAEFWEGDATKQKSVKRSAFSLNGFQAFSE